MWQLILAFTGLSATGKALSRIEKERRKYVICSRCEAEMPKRAKFCKVCGSKHLIPKPTFLENKQKEKIALQKREREDRNFQERYFSAKRHLDSFRNYRFCTSCGESFQPGHAFCTSCGIRTTSYNEDHAREALRYAYPDIAKSEDDIDYIDSLVPPDVPSVADAAVGITKTVIKSGMKIGWNGTKYVLRSLLK